MGKKSETDQRKWQVVVEQISRSRSYKGCFDFPILDTLP